MSLPTGSSLERVMACPPSWVLTSVDTESEEASKGTAVHAFLEALVMDDDVDIGTADASVRAFCSTLVVEFYDD